jgi:hypothetical protein
VLRAAGGRAALPVAAGAAGADRAADRPGPEVPRRRDTLKRHDFRSRDRARIARTRLAASARRRPPACRIRRWGPRRRDAREANPAAPAGCLTLRPGRGPGGEGGKPSAEDDQRPADARRRPNQQHARADDYRRERVAERPSKDRIVASRSTKVSRRRIAPEWPQPPPATMGQGVHSRAAKSHWRPAAMASMRHGCTPVTPRRRIGAAEPVGRGRSHAVIAEPTGLGAAGVRSSAAQVRDWSQLHD